MHDGEGIGATCSGTDLMRSSRLEMALASGAFSLPAEGDIAIYRPAEGDDFAALPISRVQIVTGFRPAAEYFTARGYQIGNGRPYSAAMVCLPRAKEAARALIARAMFEVVPGGPIAVDGQKTDGVDTVLRDCKALGLNVQGPVSKSHGKIFVLQAGGELPGWEAKPQIVDGGFQTLPGVFSANGPDAGSSLLAEVLPEDLKGRVVDLGAGWGFLSRAILDRENVQELDVVEAEKDALDCAIANVSDQRARFHWADARTFRPARPAHAVVMNPPFHTGREADVSLGVAFLKSAAGMLVPDGSLWMVSNRHLPYDKPLNTLFKRVEDLGGTGTFRLTRASLPVKTR